jgi:hypothetical protein
MVVHPNPFSRFKVRFLVVSAPLVARLGSFEIRHCGPQIRSEGLHSAEVVAARSISVFQLNIADYTNLQCAIAFVDLDGDRHTLDQHDLAHWFGSIRAAGRASALAHKRTILRARGPIVEVGNNVAIPREDNAK